MRMISGRDLDFRRMAATRRPAGSANTVTCVEACARESAGLAVLVMS